MNKYVLGVDPGASGALAFLREDGSLETVIDMPTILVKVGTTERNRVSAALLVQALTPYKGQVSLAVLEKVGGITQQSASASFTFGYACGIVEGVLAGLEFPVTLVTPQAWKKRMGLGSADKGLARQMAIRLWPTEADRFKRVKDADKAEAALLAKYGLLTSA